MTKYTLDFNLLPDLQFSTWIYNLGDEIQNGLRPLAETLSRADASMFFVYKLACDNDYSTRKEAYLRAALAEFVSMEEALVRDLVNVGTTKPAIKCTDTNDPVLHITKSLRNIEIHLHSSQMSSFNSTVWLGSVSKPEEGKSIEHMVWYIDDITASTFNSLHVAKRYNNNDMIKMIDWFNTAQKIWGVYEIVRLAILRYSKKIIDMYKLV